MGSYNINNLHSPISLMIGKELINIANLPVLTDSIGSFGSPTSDSERAMITNNVNKILICIYSFSGKADIETFTKI